MNKPVAWMSPTGFAYHQSEKDFAYEQRGGWIPLYTHPVKELTDEEIIKEALDIGFIVEQDLSYEWREYTQEFIACVKAILRKAQEK